MNYISYSKLKEWDMCPYRYNWIYNEKKEYKYPIEYEENRFAHSLLNEYVWHLVYDKKEAALDCFELQFNWLWNTIYSKILSDKSEKSVKENVLNYINNDIVKNIDYAKVRNVMPYFKFYLSELEYYLSGMFDRLDFEEQDQKKLNLIVYRYHNEFSELQYAVYSYALHSAYAIYNKKEIHIINLIKNEIIKQELMLENNAKKIILDKVNLFLNDKEFKTKENFTCEICSIKNLCNGETK